jgi:methylphosphotriester-DNA--protein-cysteine methyltransferase
MTPFPFNRLFTCATALSFDEIARNLRLLNLTARLSNGNTTNSIKNVVRFDVVR